MNKLPRLRRISGAPACFHRNTPALAWRSAIVAAAALLAAACGDGGTEPEPKPNRPPVASGTIPAQTVAVDESVTVNVASAFSDPDGDALTYSAASSARAVASVAVSGADVTVTGVSAGTASVTVTASDPDGLSAEQVFQVTVPNRAPVVTDSIPGPTVHVGDSVSVDLAGHFSDPDGDALTYTAESSATGVASVSVSGADVTVTGVSAGTASVTVTASDPDGLSAEQVFQVTVEPNPDREALVALYNATDGPNWKNNRGWLTDAPLGQWYGVKVNGRGKVVKLDLWGNDLMGSIPPELGQLANLTDLFLRANNLPGSIPPELGRLANLNRLWLWGNDLTGSIPPELGQLANLTYLGLDFNYDLTGPIPPELGGLANLTNLSLTDNDLTGPIPPELGELSNLIELSLGQNKLTGPIPSELGGLANLTVLNLTWNELTGPIPSELGGLINLTRLFLGLNDLTGSIPPELGRLANLTHLALQGNELTDEFPASFASLSAVERALWGANAGLCAPRTAAFDAWLAVIESRGGWSGPRCAAAASDRKEALKNMKTMEALRNA